MPKWKVTAAEIPGLLESLACGDAETQQETLRQLCPCRSHCNDQEIWTEICHIYHDVCTTERVRHQAFHALETLVERGASNGEAHELLQWLTDTHRLALPLEKAPATRKSGVRLPRREPKVRSRDLPRLLAVLECGEPGEKQQTLKALCPCRNARYDQDVWLAIFREYETAEVGEVRDQAGHAIQTLLERARADPRSQELLRWLSAQGVRSLPLEETIPVWRPGGRAGLNGLYIPRYEPGRRSRANRRR